MPTAYLLIGLRLEQAMANRTTWHRDAAIYDPGRCGQWDSSDVRDKAKNKHIA